MAEPPARQKWAVYRGCAAPTFEEARNSAETLVYRLPRETAAFYGEESGYLA